MWLWILMMAAPFIIGGFLKLVGGNDPANVEKAGQPNKSRFFRAGGDSPWDFLDEVGGSSKYHPYESKDEIGNGYLSSASIALFSLLTPNSGEKKRRPY